MVKALEDWKAPWEGEGKEIDPARAKIFAHKLLVRAESLETELASERAKTSELQTKVTAFETKDMTEIERLKHELEEARKAPKGSDKTSLDAILEVAAEDKVNLTPAQMRAAAKRVSGSTFEELLADAREFIEESGWAKAPTDPPASPARRPRSVSTGLVDDKVESIETDPAKIFASL